MTQNEIIEMARQAGFEEQFTRPQDAIVRKGFALSGEFKGYKANNAALEAFAKLVAAKEREACANMCDVAAEQCGETISNFGANELMEKSVATGAMYQAKKLSKSIRARGEA